MSNRMTYDRLTEALRAVDATFPQEEAWRRIEAKAVTSAALTAVDIAEWVYHLIAGGVSTREALDRMEREL